MGHEVKITVITPSVRKEFLSIVGKSLKRQTFKDFEWLVVGPDSVCGYGMFIKEPPKRKGDYYALNKAYNKGFSKAKGRLIVSLQDGIWITPDTLQNLWEHYIANPTACVGAIGHQYARVENGKPEGLVWSDPRARTDLGSFYEIGEMEFEISLASFPRQAIYDISGFDEAYDVGAACSEKDAAARMYKAGYKLFLSQAIEYRAIKHGRIGGDKEWNKHFKIASEMYNRHIKEINEGRRLKLNYI